MLPTKNAWIGKGERAVTPRNSTPVANSDTYLAGAYEGRSSVASSATGIIQSASETDASAS
jgi:hypothetical protein